MATITRFCGACGEKINLDDAREFGFCNICGEKILIKSTDKIVESKEYPKEIRDLLESAEKGNQDAQHDLANRYLYGKGVEQDFSQARIWKTRACGDSALGKKALKLFEDLITDVEKNLAKGIMRTPVDRSIPPPVSQPQKNAPVAAESSSSNKDVLLQRAQNGDADAQYELASYYMYQEANLNEAEKWLNICETASKMQKSYPAKLRLNRVEQLRKYIKKRRK